MRSFSMMTAALAAVGILGFGLSSVAAQPYAAPPPNATPGYYPAMPPPPGYMPGFHYRRGFTIGFGFGFGDMSTDTGPIDCDGCVYQPLSFSGDFHIGFLPNPRMALLFEGWVVARPLDVNGFETLQQGMAMFAVQYWLNPRLWAKGGLGLASLDITYDIGSNTISEPLAGGGGIMGAIGYELIAGPRFAIDLQLRLGTGSYDQGSIHAGNLAIGFNWY